MELVFLAVLFIIMIAALGSGFPVAFALPGAAILSVLFAGFAGEIFAGDSSAFFAQGNPREWLTAGVTNFRGIYWDVDRDTLIAIPLFIFMGIMLQRSKIAEDLLVTMAQLFGSIRGGLGISVVFVGALLAATTGIVGATVVAMGLISLPAMLRNKYDTSLTTGTICAAGTLGQIIPPSIVLIILADQLASAADQAASERQALYREITGEFSMPSNLDIVSTSAGEMFLGAILPGLVLVGLYMLFILVLAWIRPKVAPPVPYEGKRLDAGFLLKVAIALVPPLILIFAVLGSILLGIATVNQAGAIGASGATIMAGYRLYPVGGKRAYYPAILALIALIALWLLTRSFNLNVRTIETAQDQIGLALAVIASVALLAALCWSGWRVLRTDHTLHAVMAETAKTTSMVFIILLGAAMLTAAFRGFGGEEIVRHSLGGLPGGFWAKFFVVMAVMFVLGFFLDFIEIAVVVVPIVAPILLADPSANVSAVWLGVIIAINLQTSFLTPPFGFALFYLRGVAPPKVKTTDIYRGVAPFIALQLMGLAIVGAFPALVNYLPNRAQLTSELSPPPKNPRLQLCMQEVLMEDLPAVQAQTEAQRRALQSQDLSLLPPQIGEDLRQLLAEMDSAFALPAELRAAQQEYDQAASEFRPLHRQARTLERRLARLEDQRLEVEERIEEMRQDAESIGRIARLEEKSARLARQQDEIRALWPSQWESAQAEFDEDAGNLRAAQLRLRRALDNQYADLLQLIEELPADNPDAAGLSAALAQLEEDLRETFGLRSQSRLPRGIALRIARCRSLPEDIALSF